MKKKILFAAAIVACILAISCNNESPSTITAGKTDTVGTSALVTNPYFAIAPVEFSELAEKSLKLMGNFEFDAWGEMLADDVMYAFPDGDVDTRTKLVGKAAVLAWWKNWKETSGIESMTMSELNHFPLNVTGEPKGGALKGNYDFVYFSNKMVYAGKPVSVRMNFAVHFNESKKIDRYVTYYDRSVIIKAIGKNLLENK